LNPLATGRSCHAEFGIGAKTFRDAQKINVFGREHFLTKNDELGRTLGYADMRRLHGRLAAGLRFAPTWHVLTSQMRRVLPLWVSDQFGPPPPTERGDAIAGKIDVWLPLFYGASDAIFSIEDLQIIAGRSRQLSGLLNSVVDRWRTENRLKFDDWFRQEVQGHVRFLERVGAQPFSTDPRAIIWRDILNAVGGDDELARTRGREFLLSNTFEALPSVRIGAALWAGLAHRIVHGGQGAPKPSFANDVDFIASYLPYCDAMLIEATCCDLLTSNPVRAMVPEIDHVFVTNSLENFLSYLKDLENSVDDERRALVADAYGEEWDRPELQHFLH